MPEDGDEGRIDSVLARKLKKTLECRLEADQDTLAALTELSTFFTENNLQTRRNLRGEIERRSLQINQDFLVELGGLKERVEGLQSSVAAMGRSCGAMQARLADSRTATAQLMAQTAEVQATGRTLETQAGLAERVRAKLSLSPSELAALQGRPGPQFFLALEKVRIVHHIAY